jgi:2-isopropylmalate synthase
VIRINSQSGKGGVAWVLEQDHGRRLPRAVLVEFSKEVQKRADDVGGELTSRVVWGLFEETYLASQGALAIRGYEHPRADDPAFQFDLALEGRAVRVRAQGTGPIDALVAALSELRGGGLRVVDYSEHALGGGADARAAAYVEVEGNSGRLCGVGIHEDIVMASLRAVLSAVDLMEVA